MKTMCKKTISVLLCALMLCGTVPFGASAADDEPYVLLATNPKTAVAGQAYSFDLFRFHDAGCTHHVTYKFFADSGEGYENDRYADDEYDFEQGFDLDDPYPLFGVRFDSDGRITGTPTLEEGTDRMCIHFNAYVIWTNEQGETVKEESFNYSYESDGVEVEDTYYFRLYIVSSSETVEIPEEVRDLRLGWNYLLTGDTGEKWFVFTACAAEYEVELDYYISKIIHSDSPFFSDDYEFYPFTLNVYDSNGVPVGSFWVPVGGGGEDFFSGYIHVQTVPGETYYVKATFTNKFGFNFWPYHDRNLFYSSDSKVNTVEFIETKTYDIRSDSACADKQISEDFTKNTIWNVYRVHSAVFDWSAQTKVFPKGCGTLKWEIPMETETDYVFDVHVTNTGDFSEEDVQCYGSHKGIWIYGDVVCFDAVDLTTEFTVDVYVFPDQKVIAEDGVLKVVENTGYEQADQTTGIIAEYGDGCFVKAVDLKVEQQERASDDWQKYEFDLSLRVGDEKMQAVYLIRMVDENGNVVQPNAGHKVTLRIPIPAGCNAGKCRIAHLLDDQGTSESFKLNPTGKAKPFTISEDGRYFIIEVTSFSPFIVFEEQPLVTFKMRDTKKILPYGERRILTADTENLPDGAKIVWSADNDRVTLNPSADGKTCEVFAKKHGKVTVTAKAVDSNGRPVEQEGKTVFASVTLQTKANIFHKLFYMFFRIPWPFG